MTGYETIEFSVDGPVGNLTLDRPGALNAYSVRMRDELHEVFTACARDTELSVLVVRGAGRAFCAGADLTEFGTAPSPFGARRVRFARDVWGALGAVPVPVVAVLHGHVIGSGLELALLCTLRVAASSARLLMPEAALSLVPAACGTQTLPRLAGAQRAGEMLFLGRPVLAPRAAELGLVDAVVDGAALEPAVVDLVGALAARPRDHLVALVRLLRLQDHLGLRDAMAAEQALASAIRRGRTSARPEISSATGSGCCPT